MTNKTKEINNDNQLEESIIFTPNFNVTDHDPDKEKRKYKRLENKLSTALSADGVDPLYNSEDVPDEIIKKIKNKDKQFKKEQRTKALNIINQDDTNYSAR